jgi:hypothetical protein
MYSKRKIWCQKSVSGKRSLLIRIEDIVILILRHGNLWLITLASFNMCSSKQVWQQADYQTREQFRNDWD